jgi:hypothetical protein
MSDEKRDAVFRALSIVDLIDVEIKQLCEKYGYGAVMDSASRQWILKDSVGALYVAGECLNIEDIYKYAEQIKNPAERQG